jgi:hypothetical protein
VRLPNGKLQRDEILKADTVRLHTPRSRANESPSLRAIWLAFSARIASVPVPTLPSPTIPTLTSRT